MKRFEASKTYDISGYQAGTNFVEKRTECYVWFTGSFTGKRRIIADYLFGLGENILIPSEYSGLTYFCFADSVVES